MKRIVLTSSLATFLLAGAASAAPLRLTTSGYLLDNGDNPVSDPSLAMSFRLYNVRNAGDATETLVWESASCPVAVRAGFYAVVLGDECNGSTALADMHLNPGDSRFLEVTVGGARLVPRMQVNAVPNAMNAARALDAEKLGGKLPSEFAAALHRHPTGNIDGFDAQAVAAMGEKGATNPLHHDRYSDAEAVSAVQGAGLFAGVSHSHAPSDLTGVLPVTQGGTGLASGPTAAGQFLRSTGAGAWAAGAIQASDLPPIADRVSKAGDTMTGALNLPANGLKVGTTQLVATGDKLGVGTATPTETLTVAGSISGGGLRRLAVNRTIGSAAGNWVELGTFASGTGTFARVLIWGHWDSTLFANEYDVQALQPYAGTTTDWIQVAPTHGRGWTNGEENLTLDVRIAAQNQPLELRVRRVSTGGNAGTFTASIESNATFAERTGAGTLADVGTIAPGYLGRAAARFPVSTDRFGATTEGLHVLGNGNVAIGTTTAGTKLEVIGTATVTNLNTTTPWIDMLMPAGWSAQASSTPKCRVVNGWVEFRGTYLTPNITGWPGATVTLLPTACRPTVTRYTEMPCHGIAPKNSVCNNDFFSDGRVAIHTDTGANQQRFEGVRIWAGAD